jgi:hypothetical protein
VNVDQIYQAQRDEAFANQFSSTEYTTFVAMPFSNTGGYPEGRIKALLSNVHARANELLPHSSPQSRQFSPLLRVDQMTTGATVITDNIIRGILGSHFYFGDLTGCNFGVVLETGIALALKPNERAILFTQDGVHSLHFDLRVTHIQPYREENLVESLATALVHAAHAFELEADSYIRFVSSKLTPDAISVLNIYGRLWKDRANLSDQPGIWEDSAAAYSARFHNTVGAIAFHNAIRELAEHRLFWTHYRPAITTGVDAYAVHTTKLGWRVIENLWAHDPDMREPSNSVTGL